MKKENTAFDYDKFREDVMACEKTQYQMTKEADVNRTLIGKIIHEGVQPGSETLFRLCKVMGTTPNKYQL